MPGHTLAPSTQTLALTQLSEINEGLAAVQPGPGESPQLTAQTLGLAGTQVHPRLIDRTAALGLARQERRGEALVLPAAAALYSVLAIGDPNWPYLYGIFGEEAGRRRLPVILHAEHLRMVSRALGLHRHHWEH